LDITPFDPASRSHQLAKWPDESLRSRRIFAGRQPNKHADSTCLLLGHGSHRPEHYGACSTRQEIAP